MDKATITAQGVIKALSAEVEWTQQLETRSTWQLILP